MGSRLSQVRARTGLSGRQFAFSIGVDPSQYAKTEKGVYNLPVPKLEEVSSKYGVSVDWLLTGEGEMAMNHAGISNARPVSQFGRPHVMKNKVLVDLGDGKFELTTPLITQKAKASYLAGWGDPEYMESLPTHRVIMPHAVKGEYITVEADGDSMDDGTKNAIPDGSLCTGRKVARHLWQDSKLHLERDFIIHTLDGLVIKRITEHDLEAGTITCHSLNPNKKLYPDFKIQVSTIAQIFHIVTVTYHRA